MLWVHLHQPTSHYQLWSMSRMILNLQHLLKPFNVNTIILPARCTVSTNASIALPKKHLQTSQQQETGVWRRLIVGNTQPKNQL